MIGELALGHLGQRHEVIGLLVNLSQATVATDEEVRTLINCYQLYGLGIGYVDAQLLAATQLTDGAALWTADRRLVAAALQVGCAIDPENRHRQPPIDGGGGRCQ
ncbi:MAG: hypothetical protein ACRDUV_12175 [Pseudonocardiaceae bacterium]